LAAGYGAFLVLRDLKLEARPGLTVILGPNGAGKTTLLKAIAGLIPRGGRLRLDGETIAADAKTSEIVRRGLVLVPEGRQLFGQMTVRENLELGGWLASKAEREERLAQVLKDFPKLAERTDQLAGTMSGGEQQMVAVARAMMGAPRLLMLDEPSLGLAPKMVGELLAIARRIADQGVTVLMVEQNVRKALAVADRGYVLERGRIVASGPATLLARSRAVREAYLGSKPANSADTSAANPNRSKEPTVAELNLLINGLAVSAERGATFERRNPLDSSVASRAPAASTGDAVLAVEAAAEAFRTWRSTGPNERRALLLKAADALEAKTPKFVEAVPAETGATAMWAGFNVMLAAGMIREAAALTTQVGGEVIPSDVPGSLALGMRQPAGVVLGIALWNAPVILGVRAIATPLACGNTVILNGSENCPRTHALIAEAFQEAGFPPEVVNYLSNAPADAAAVVEAMVAHPAVKRVNFTGSTRVGKLLALTCAKYLKPVLLELGGKADSTLMPATIIDRVTRQMRLYHEETFGPVKCIVRVDGLDAAVACANDNDYGLAAAVFGRDTARAIEVARRIESGICHVNGPTVHDEAQMPFGGVKGSGMGRFGGKAGIAEFTDLRWITVQTGERHYPF
jgi:acyl-CoA reductase-like NAD-dependent aldehyde dehydrogenase/ABC-type branched-subunit amino acid transport system ATPase component